MDAFEKFERFDAVVDDLDAIANFRLFKGAERQFDVLAAVFNKKDVTVVHASTHDTIE
jgi:hypothetical protein